MRRELRFLLNDREYRLRDVDPTRTVLQFLREDIGRCGSKEGCAEGDCGACTVVLAEPSGNGLRYQAVNACIQFLPTLDGKQLITVEDLAKGPELHPVQQAMVDTHGSQCGFCTPGFVMSLFALYHSKQSPDRQTIIDHLAGNLCRCTGYGPIIEAANRSCGDGAGMDQFSAGAARVREALDELTDDQCLMLEHQGRQYFAPTNRNQLIELLREHPDSQLLAGGTDIGLWVTKQHRQIDSVIFLGQVRELRRLEQGADALMIGAAVTLSDAMQAITRHYPDFGELLRRYAAVPIRNQATLGGNIANGSPIGDSPPPLMAAGAELVLDGPDGERRLPLEAYFLEYGRQDRQPGEYVSMIRLPLPQAGQHFACYKLSKRFDQDISAVCAAFRLTLDPQGVVSDFRSGFGGMAGIPARATRMEQAIIGNPWNEDTVALGRAALTEDFSAIDDLRASAHYRMTAAANLLTRFHAETSGSDQPTRLFGHSEHAHGSR
jgi:xanthine dehydrogenase small subunit